MRHGTHATPPFGRWLKQLRSAQDLTQEALAEQAGYAVGAIRKLEQGDRRPSRKMAERLAEVLALPPDDRAVFVRAARGATAPTPTVGAPSLILLSTKLSVPSSAPVVVPRTRLLEQLDAGRTRKLTLVCAPAGFGKTTLLSTWLQAAGSGGGGASATLRGQAWLALDADDNDPTSFLRYLVAALQRAAPQVGLVAAALFEAPEPPAIPAVLTSLINDLAAVRHPVLLVLDDYHVITTPAIHEALTFLLDHLPATVQLVIASREDPPLPLPRLRARGQLAELRAADLRFAAGEAAAFLRNVMGLDLTAAEVATLDARTEGWIAGLQLAALALRDRHDRATFIAAFAGSNRFIIDYLASEVLDRLPADMRAFMLRTAILQRFCGPLCDAILGLAVDEQDPPRSAAPASITHDPQPVGSASQAMLDRLDRANMFLLPLDDQRRWYRYHQLFADVLREQLGRTVARSDVAALHRRASRWFADQGLVAEAIHHALAAGDVAHAAELIENVAASLALEGQQATVRNWLAQLPEALVDVRPRLALARAYVHTSNGEYAAVEADLQAVEARMSVVAEGAALMLRGEMAALRALARSMLGDPRAIAAGQDALMELPLHHPLRSMAVGALTFVAFASGELDAADRALQDVLAAPAREPGQRLVQLGLAALLAMVRRAQGRLRDVRRMSQEVLDGSRRDGQTLPVAGAFLAYLLLGLTQCEQNDLDAAERTLRACAQLAVHYQAPVSELLAQFYLGQVHAARGDVAGALRLVEHALAVADRYLSPVNLRELDGYRVMLWLRQGDIARASDWAARHAPTMNAGRPRFTPYDYDRLALVQTRMAQGDWDAAYVGASRLLEDAEVTGHGRFVIWALVWQAQIRCAQHQLAEALAPLARALALAAPEGYVRVFVDEGAPMAALLREALRRGIAPAYVERLLAAFPPQPAPGIGPSEPAPGRWTVPLPAAVEPLSVRELEVLRLLATGHDNTAIAHALVIAVSTVKSHVNHIFAKLGVRTRVEAVLRAQELQLL